MIDKWMESTLSSKAVAFLDYGIQWILEKD